MDLLPQIMRFLQYYQISPKPHLGQCFLVDSILLKRMISYALIDVKDVVLEVGAGLGFLTQFLSKKSRRVIAVEIDHDLIKILRKQIQGLKNVDVIEGDLLKVTLPRFNKIVSSPPYAISSSLLLWILERDVDCAVLIFQKEFADRLIAPVGSKDYGRLTVYAHFFLDVDLLEHVSRDCFFPPPKVDSVVVRLRTKKSPVMEENAKTLFKFVNDLFTQRNKKVKNAIIPILNKKGIKGKCAKRIACSLPFWDRRVRKLKPEDFSTLEKFVNQLQG